MASVSFSEDEEDTLETVRWVTLFVSEKEKMDEEPMADVKRETALKIDGSCSEGGVDVECVVAAAAFSSRLPA